MADVKISALPAATTPLAGTEVLPIVQSSTTKKVSVADLTAGRSVGGTDFIPSGSSVPTNGMYLPAANTLGFSTNSSERMRITSGGTISLSATSNGSADIQVINNTNGLRLVGGTTIGTDSEILLGGSASGTGSNIYFDGADKIFRTAAGSEQARISSAGDVGIGTSSPATKLNIENAGACQLQMAYSSTIFGRIGRLSSGNYEFSAYENGANLLFGTTTTNGSTTERMRISSSGDLLVGTTTTGSYADGKITVDTSGTGAAFKTSTVGTAATINWNSATSGDNQFVYFVTETSPTLRGNIAYNRAGGLVAYNVTSDYRAKDIISTTVNSGEVIDSVPVYMGKMKDATQERPMFIAHETPSYAHTGKKDAVDKDGKPVYQQMDASTLIPVMWAEIQSLRQRIKTLENK